MHNESHGSHVCHKCGWTYPNPHPSAKHRRAHKKVCGKHEGFKIPESEEKPPFVGSDGGHLSDEDHNKVEENQSGGIRRQVSNRSEEEEFSDAASEFTDTGTSSTVVGSVVDASAVEPDANATATTNIIKPSNNPTQGIQIQIPHALQLDSDEQFQHHSSATTMGSMTGSISDKSAEQLAVEPTKETNNSANLVTSVKNEGPENELLENILTDDYVMDTVTFIEQNTDTRAKSKLDGSLSAMAALPSKTMRGTSETGVKLQTMDGFTGEAISMDVTDATTAIMTDTEPLDAIVDSKQEETNSLGKNEHLENILTGNNVMHTMAFIEQNTDTKGKSKLDGSLSPMAASPSKTMREASETSVKLQTMDGFTGEAISPYVTDSITIIMTDPKPLDAVVDSKQEETNSLGQKMSPNEFSHDNCSHSMEVEAAEHVGASVGITQPEVDCAQKVDIGCPDKNVEGCIAKEVSTNLPALSKPADFPSEELSEMTVKDCKYPEPVKSELSVTPDCGEATREMEVKNPVSEETNSGFQLRESGDGIGISSSATQVHEENLQILERKVMVEQVSIDCVTDISKAEDATIEGLASHGLEDLPDATSSDIKYGEKNQMVCSLEGKESHSQPDLRQNPMVVAAGGATMLSPTDAVVHEAINAVSSQDDIVHENARIDNSGNCIREGTMEENFRTNRMDAPEATIFLSEPEGNLEEAESVPLDTVVDSSGMVINTSPMETVREPLSDLQVRQGENFSGNSEELEFSKSIDTSVSKSEAQVEAVGTDSMVAEALHEETKLNHSSEVGLFESGAQNSVQFMSSAVDTGYCVLGSDSVEENSTKSFAEVYASDIHSESLKEEGDYNLLKQRPDASEVVPPDGSVDSISQTDSVEGYWGSVSDGRVPSLRDATDALPTPAAEILPETEVQTPKEEAQVAELKKTGCATEDRLTGNSDVFEAPSFMTLVEPGKGDYKQSASSEIQAIQNPQQPHSSYLQAGWFPSLSHITTESQGRKKNEKIIEKVANWNSGKSRTPLKSLLVEANLESKQKAAVAQDHPKLPLAHKDDTTFPPHNGLSASKTSDKQIEKEWNSPARLPEGREKRKQKYWVPFVCCSSVN